MAGLSMGGIQTLNIAVAKPELFQYVGVFSSGWFARPFGNNPQMSADDNYKKLAERKDLYNKQFKQFYLTMGGQEDIAFNNCKTMREKFDEIGIKYKYFETPGGHTWPVWRESLYQFAQLLWK
jgi:enterochelin esterase-like enzyme